MRLLYIANIRLPTEKGNGIQIMEMCSAFAKAMADKFAFASLGAEVHLIVPTRRNPKFGEIDPFEYYGVEKNFDIQYLETFDPTWLMKLGGGVYIKVQSLLFIWSLRKYFQREITNDKSQITNKSQTPNSKPYTLNPATTLYTRDEYLLPFLLRYSNNVVWEAHTLPTRRRWYLKYWNRCRSVIAITNGLKDILVTLGVPKESILVASDGVDLKKFESRPASTQRGEKSKVESRKKIGLPVDRNIILYTGQLFDWKGATVLLDAVRKFQIPNSKFQINSNLEIQNTKQNYPLSTIHYPLFVFVGGMEKDVERFRERARGLNNVFIVGHVPYSQLPEFMACVDVAVLPNRKGTEISETFTSPLKLFQYMASGVPIVASDLPSIREVLNESNAVLIEPNNPEALARGIQHVLDDFEQAEQLASQALRDVKKYSWESRAERIIDFLK